jgi:hypothetical protein
LNLGIYHLDFIGFDEKIPSIRFGGRLILD